MRKKDRNRHIASAVAVAGVLSLGVAPAWAQQGKQNKNQQSSQSSQSRQQEAMADGMIPASALQDHRVMDAQNREIGTITNFFIDPQTGKIQRANIEFSSSVFGSDHKYSVDWDKLNVKRQGNDLIVTLDESVVKRVQQAGAGGRITDGGGVYSQERDARDRQAARDTGVLGMGEKQKDQRQISASQLSSAQIRKVQQELNKKGFHAGQVNGQWSSETQSAIRNFQQSKGLQPTGQLDERTMDELGLDADEFRKSSRAGSESSATGQSNQRNTR